MIGLNCCSYEEGLRIKEIIDKKEIVLYSNHKEYVYGYEQVIYLYSNEKLKEEHEKQMKTDNWKTELGQSMVSIYRNFHDERRISVPSGIYTKVIKGSLE